MPFKLVFAIILTQSALLQAKPYIAFIGDSITAGAVVDPKISFDVESLWPRLMGRTDRHHATDVLDDDYDLSSPRPGSPVLLGAGPRDFQSAAIWFPSQLLKITSDYFINSPRYSWANFVAHSLGFASSETLFAAENGHKSDHAVAQMARVLKYTNRDMPEKLFIFYTGNDICSPVLQMMTPKSVFQDNISAAIDYALKHAKFPANQYDVYLVPFLQLSQLYGETLLMGKRVKAHGKTMLCGDLLKEQPKPWILASGNAAEAASANIIFNLLPFPKNQAAYCPSLFGRALDQPRDDQQYHRSLIANRIRAYRDSMKEIVENVSRRLEKNSDIQLGIHLLTSPATHLFRAQDFAADCFHLSATGQWRLAKLILEELERKGGRPE